MDGGDHFAVTHLAVARDQNPGNGISGIILKVSSYGLTVAVFLMSKINEIQVVSLKRSPQITQKTAN